MNNSYLVDTSHMHKKLVAPREGLTSWEESFSQEVNAALSGYCAYMRAVGRADLIRSAADILIQGGTVSNTWSIPSMLGVGKQIKGNINNLPEWIKDLVVTCGKKRETKKIVIYKNFDFWIFIVLIDPYSAALVRDYCEQYANIIKQSHEPNFDFIVDPIEIDADDYPADSIIVGF